MYMYLLKWDDLIGAAYSFESNAHYRYFPEDLLIHSPEDDFVSDQYIVYLIYNSSNVVSW